jgi:hypothetical protein
LDPLIKSQLLYQLSYAPIELAGPGPGKARHVAKAGWTVQPQIPSSLLPQVGCERLTRSPPRSPISLGEIPWRFPKSGQPRPRPEGSLRTTKSWAASVQRAFLCFLFLMSNKGWRCLPQRKSCGSFMTREPGDPYPPSIAKALAQRVMQDEASDMPRFVRSSAFALAAALGVAAACAAWQPGRAIAYEQRVRRRIVCSKRRASFFGRGSGCLGGCARCRGRRA